MSVETTLVTGAVKQITQAKEALDAAAKITSNDFLTQLSYVLADLAADLQAYVEARHVDQ